MKLYFLVPLLSALIGWFTNWLAIRALFKPEKPSWFFGYQGVIPRRQELLADRIGAVVEDELLTQHDIAEAITKPEYVDAIVASIESRVERFLNENFGVLPFFDLFKGSAPVQRIKQSHLELIRKEVQDELHRFLFEAEQKIEIRDLVARKIKNLSIARFERLVRSVASKELRTIELMGAFVGFLIGVVQVLLIQFGI